MEIWTREDGRFYCAELTQDLFGYVVMIAHGGKLRPPRIRSIPVLGIEEGERVIARIERRRALHGYERAERSS